MATVLGREIEPEHFSEFCAVMAKETFAEAKRLERFNYREAGVEELAAFKTEVLEVLVLLRKLSSWMWAEMEADDDWKRLKNLAEFPEKCERIASGLRLRLEYVDATVRTQRIAKSGLRLVKVVKAS